MLNFLIRRFLSFIPVLFVCTVATFALMKMAPGGPWDRDSESKPVPPLVRKLLDERYGLNKPAWRQYVGYMLGDFDKDGAFVCGALCGNLGPSYRQYGKNVEEVLFGAPGPDRGFLDSKFGHSLRLGVMALMLALAVGVPAGVLAALKQGSVVDHVITLLTNIGVAVPNFVLAFFAIVVLAVGLKLMPVVQRSWDGVVPWLLPALIFGFGMLATTSRLMRGALIEVMRLDYIRTARAKGAREGSVIWRHMLRNALIPVATTLGPAFAGLITGSLVIETIFGVPGTGRDFILSIGNRDYSMIMGTTLIFIVLILLSNLSVDLLYGFIDPRIRVD